MRTVMLGVLVSVLAAGPVAAAGEQWLEYRTAADPSAHDAIGGQAQLEQVPAAPEGLELPKFVAEKPLLARWKTPLAPAGFLWVAFDQSKKGGAYDRLYMDTNCSGKLVDKTPIAANGNNGYQTEFGPIKITFPGDDGPVTYHLMLGFYSYSGTQTRLYARAACWYEGRVQVGGRERRCLVCDCTANGSFSDIGGPWNMVDRILIEESSKDDKGKETVQLAGHFLGQYELIEKKFYRVEIARDGSSVKFTFDENLPLGKVRLPQGMVGIGLCGERGWLQVQPDAEGVCLVPLGTYNLWHWAYADRRDAAGKLWYMTGHGDDTPAGKTFEVRADGEAAPQIGEPIQARLKMTNQGKAHLFNLSLVSGMDEAVTIGRKDGGAPEVRVTLRIKSDAGDYTKALNFEHG